MYRPPGGLTLLLSGSVVRLDYFNWSKIDFWVYFSVFWGLLSYWFPCTFCPQTGMCWDLMAGSQREGFCPASAHLHTVSISSVGTLRLPLWPHGIRNWDRRPMASSCRLEKGQSLPSIHRSSSGSRVTFCGAYQGMFSNSNFCVPRLMRMQKALYSC